MVGGGPEGGAAGPRDAGGRGEVTIRDASEADTPVVARLHAEQIAGGFLSTLGPGFLTHLYRRVLRHSDSFLLVAEDGGQTAGFIAGAGDLGGLYRSFLWHDGARAAATSVGPLLRRWRSVVETLRHGTGGEGTGHGVELLAIAVDPGHRDRGVGAQLVGAFLARVTSRGGDGAYVVVATENAGAIRLYRRAGFSGDETFQLHAGSTSLVMQWLPGAIEGT